MSRRIPHFKLVRDRIPEIICKNGDGYAFRTIAGDELENAMRQKIAEEAAELAQAKTRKQKLLELADLTEIVNAFLAQTDISMEEIDAIQKQRRAERGGFENGIYLEYTESPKP